MIAARVDIPKETGAQIEGRVREYLALHFAQNRFDRLRCDWKRFVKQRRDLLTTLRGGDSRLVEAFVETHDHLRGSMQFVSKSIQIGIQTPTDGVLLHNAALSFRHLRGRASVASSSRDRLGYFCRA